MFVPEVVIVTIWLPLGASAPLQLPLAVQLVAFTETQDSVVDPPIGTVELPKVSTGTTTATLAWMNPYPESKFGVGLPIESALFLKAW